ncbi:transcription factor IIIB 90 kDa subunit [Polyergus mexicanus]|uniref:transcription factor IIIB 90 kDa subunit n=1 Tax=Polyergus mexicanus TaxID=615972 RepID=UPI0038B598DC
MSGNKCRNCGSTNIETDPARGDAICMECGFVLEDSVIVSQPTFEESSSGKIMPKYFVPNDSTGGATNFGARYFNEKESRKNTIENARKGIIHLGLQLGLDENDINMSVTFYKMALDRNLTRGRKQVHNQAACVYITCRHGNNTLLHPIMLIDISDILHICVYELGRTYLRFTQALGVNIVFADPCLYIEKFAQKLEFGDKTDAVGRTATRILQRMNKDSIHIGRRPSGLCGAALLIAARLHEFNRSPTDIIKIVKVHESTLRKRLMEFGDTPSSALTLDEFETVDLEEEDPPAFKAARKKDRERLQRLENIDVEINELQAEIDKQLEDYRTGKAKKRKNVSSIENEDADRFIQESNLNIIQQYVENHIDDPDENFQDDVIDESNSNSLLITKLGPDIASMILTNNRSNEPKEKDNNLENSSEEIYTTDIDDEELDSYILSEKESQSKSALWNKVNADYLVQQKEKEEKRLKEKEEGKNEKKRRKTVSRKNKTPANTAGEAIEKMLQEKKISSKINYEVLKSINNQQQSNQELLATNMSELDDATVNNPVTSNSTLKTAEVPLSKKYRSIKPNTEQLKRAYKTTKKEEEESMKKKINSEDVITADMSENVYDNDDYFDEEEPDPTEISLGQILESHATSEDEFCDHSYEYE